MTEWFELVIRYNARTKQFTVQGPIDERGLCYLMLGMAQEQVMKRGIEAEVTRSRIKIPELHVDLDLGQD